jgi:hypothetical protein
MNMKENKHDTGFWHWPLSEYTVLRTKCYRPLTARVKFTVILPPPHKIRFLLPSPGGENEADAWNRNQKKIVGNFMKV